MSHVVLTRDGTNRRMERRVSMATSWPSGGQWMDPHAIPPHGLFRSKRAGVLVTEHTLLQVDVVFTALRIITTAILKMGDPLAYNQRLSESNWPYREYLSEQPAILTDTFGDMFQYDGRRRTIMSMALFNEAFWYVLTRDDLGYPSAIEVLHPAFMDVKRASDGGVLFQYGSGAARRELDRDNVIHIPFMAMPQARRALSTVEYMGVAGALAIAAAEFGSTWFSQGASPSFLLETDQKLGQVQAEQLAERFLIDHSGLANAHLPLVLDNGLKAKKVMASPDEAQYLQTLDYARSVIASWLGVDELVPNALQKQSPAPAHTAQERMQRFVTLTLAGYTVPLEEAYASMLPPGVKAAFLPDELTQPDPQFLAAEIEALRNTQVATINDLRSRYLGWAPLDDAAADAAITPLASNTSPQQTVSAPSD
jgi:HK97 family phage portal protein